VAQFSTLGIIAMRHFFAIVLLLAVLSVSCTRLGVPLQSGGKLSPVERENIVAIHPDFARWNPSQSALWIRHGVTRHVCIREGGSGSLTMPFQVLVFDGDGGVVEANFINAPNPSTPKAVSGVSPLRVAYERNDQTFTCSGEFSQATWRQDIQKRMDLQKRLHEIAGRWQRSGSTNFEVVKQEIDSAITNSKK
jgi:hypothetical protein